MAIAVSVVSGVRPVPGVVPGPVMFPPVVVASLSGVATVVVAVPGASSAAVLIGVAAQVPGVPASEIAFSGVLIVVHPCGDLRHRIRDDLRLEHWMGIKTADVLIMLLTGLSEILSLSLLDPRIEIPGSSYALWMMFLISETGLLELFGKTGELERSMKPGFDSFRFHWSSQPKLDGQLLPLLFGPAQDLLGKGVNSSQQTRSRPIRCARRSGQVLRISC